MQIVLKSADEIAVMREAGRIVARAHAAMKEVLQPGVSTAKLDRIAEAVIRDHGAIPAFLNYPKPSSPAFPATINASINHEIVHGIPREDRIVEDGDIISLDVGCIFQGFVGDSAWTWPVGEVSPSVQRLLEVGEEALMVGIRASVLPNDIRTVALAIQEYVSRNAGDDLCH
jgi:methionyl aminopeptidase